MATNRESLNSKFCKYVENKAIFYRNKLNFANEDSSHNNLTDAFKHVFLDIVHIKKNMIIYLNERRHTMYKAFLTLLLLACTLMPVKAEVIQLQYVEFQGTAYNPIKIIAISKTTVHGKPAINVISEGRWTDTFYYTDVKVRDKVYKTAIVQMGCVGTGLNRF